MLDLNTDCLIALIIPWLFWGVLSALLFYAGRSWFNVLMIAALVTIVLLLVTGISSAKDAMWISLLLHLFLLAYFGFSYAVFVLRTKEHGDKR